MALSRRLNAGGWQTRGTCRDPNRVRALTALGIKAALFEGSAPMDPAGALDGVTHVLLSIPPGAEGDLAFIHHADLIAETESVQWVGYLSTTGVYGNRDGAWVDETSELRPSNPRGQRRVNAEQTWLEWGARHGIAAHIFRLAGIYGPGRSVAEKIKEGSSRRISKPGHVFSRIHVEDVATVLAASIVSPRAGGIYNVCDDEPAASADVTSYVCDLLGVVAPPLISFENAEMSVMGKTFWADNRRVRNDRIKTELGVELAFPNYRAGMRSVLGL
ncbi:MAG: SDR family oxidoreductase [Pseudomonadota bacterium]|nr:SDR family oxidoreductase [Pseudomonadota bacterium]